MAENTVSVTSQDNDLKYSLTITQNGPDTAQFNVVDFDLNGGQELSSSSHVLVNIQIDGDVIRAAVKVVFWPAPITLTVNVRDVTVVALGQTKVYPLSALDRVAVLHFLIVGVQHEKIQVISGAGTSFA